VHHRRRHDDNNDYDYNYDYDYVTTTRTTARPRSPHDAMDTPHHENTCYHQRGSHGIPEREAADMRRDEPE
jgi:hypothetical protein